MPIAETPEVMTTQRKLYIESYGCAMNFSDSEIIASIMGEHGFATTQDEFDADVIFLNTCAIRDNAEQRIRERLKHLRSNKKQNRDLIIGVLGCMAERLKDKLLEEEKLVDVVAGPDSYRELPKLVAEVDDGGRAALSNSIPVCLKLFKHGIHTVIAQHIVFHKVCFDKVAADVKVPHLG